MEEKTMINEIMKRLSELPNVTLSDGQEYIQLYDAMETVKRAVEQTTWIPVNKELPKPQEDGDKDYSERVQITLHIEKDNDVVGTPIPDNATNDKIIEKIRNIRADNMSGNFVKALCIGFLMSESEKGMTNNERKCKLVKIVAKSDIGKPLEENKKVFLFDKQTMTVYAPWATCELVYALGLTIVDLSEGSDKE